MILYMLVEDPPVAGNLTIRFVAHPPAADCGFTSRLLLPYSPFRPLILNNENGNTTIAIPVHIP